MLAAYIYRCSITDASSIYRVNMISGHFLFDEAPCSGDVNNLTNSLPQSTYSVRKISNEPILKSLNPGRKPDDDQGVNHQPPPGSGSPSSSITASLHQSGKHFTFKVT